MQKSDLQIEPYTINEALFCINKELKAIKRKELKLTYFYKLIYVYAKVPTINVPKKPILLEYNSIVDIYTHITTKRYPANRKSRCKPKSK